jgi:hypothetical protein
MVEAGGSTPPASTIMVVKIAVLNIFLWRIFPWSPHYSFATLFIDEIPTVYPAIDARSILRPAFPF